MTGPSTRRRFLQGVGSTTLLALVGDLRADERPSGPSNPNPKRKMTIDLVCGNLGVRADLPTSIELAQAHGFESVAPVAPALAKLTDSQIQELREGLKAKGLVWGATGLQVDFRGDETVFRSG